MNSYSVWKSTALPLEYLQGDLFLPLAREVHLSRDFHLQGDYQRTGNSHGNGNRHMGLGFGVWGLGFWVFLGAWILVVSCWLLVIGKMRTAPAGGDAEGRGGCTCGTSSL